MHQLIIVLTVALLFLLVWQVLAKKGTPWHAARGAGIAASSSTLVALVVILACRIGIVWTPFLGIHILFGSLFFVSLFAGCATGIMKWQGKYVPPKLHRRLAWATCLFLALALVSAVVAATYRRNHTPPAFRSGAFSLAQFIVLPRTGGVRYFLIDSWFPIIQVSYLYLCRRKV